ncbi:asparaginase [Hydrogenophaga sp. IBVHS2]|uniref:asparaginase n=1 Tax=Hydrogenophaga sp. IBVHS2 TaxID=1985170 RepID=UPI000A2E3B65|nr:asparaginase [Hydrogenophaga sp. IBVHS2]OSZ66069.1 L-asparaginase [Hydrogenophaga sp. IBVHS2]
MSDAAQPRRVVILGTGGTIAGRATQAGDNVGYKAGQVPVQDLLAGLPAWAGQAVDVEQVAQINSKDMTLPVWQALMARLVIHLQRPEVAGVVITHGTDTIEETAWLLQRVLQPATPVVLTCAMRPATAVSPDGPQNLSDALAVVRAPGACGVSVVCGGQVHPARDVAKVHPYRVQPFSSGEAGPLGVVEEGRLRRFRDWPRAHPDGLDAPAAGRFAALGALARVAWVTSHADADGSLVDALLLQVAQSPGQACRGIVVAGTGNGSLHERLQAALHRARDAGIVVALATRCTEGSVVGWPAQPFPDLDGLSPAKARLELSLRLSGV